MFSAPNKEECKLALIINSLKQLKQCSNWQSISLATGNIYFDYHYHILLPENMLYDYIKVVYSTNSTIWQSCSPTAAVCVLAQIKIQTSWKLIPLN